MSKPEQRGQLRISPLTGRQVIIAPGRARRPNAFPREAIQQQSAEECPFCEGHEDWTPPAKFIWTDPNNAGQQHKWQVRVFENKFPAVAGLSDELSAAGEDHEFFPLLPALGIHEVIVESPRHVVSVTDLTPTEMLGCWLTYRHRLQELKQNPAVQYVKIFKNVGTAAGASIEHTHSQLLALPFVPPEQQARWERARQYWQREDRCLICSLLDNALQRCVRIVRQTEHFVALCPYSSRVPYETWILPRRHNSHFEHSQDGELKELCQLLAEVMQAIETTLHQPAYNYVLQTNPLQAESNPFYHWHLEILPRTTKMAGFEFGTGCYINPVAPEEAAQVLASALNSTKRV